MPTSLINPVLYLAMSVSHNNEQKDVALLVRKQKKGRRARGFTFSVRGIGIANSNSPYETRSAIVNLVQNIKPAKDDFIVLSTATPPPWHRDQGLLRMGFSKTGRRGSKKITPVLFYNWKARRPELYRISADRKRWLSNGRGENEYRKLFQNFSADVNLGVDVAFEAVYDGNNYNNANFNTNLAQCDTWYNRNKNVGLNLVRTFKKALANTFTNYAAAPQLNLPNDLQVPEGDRNEEKINEVFSSLTWAIVHQGIIAKKKESIPQGHNIASVLRGVNDEILAWGINTNKDLSFSLHGEVNLLQNHQRIHGNEALPDGTTLYSSLEPCYMCAAMYVNKVERPRDFPDTTLICYYEQNDGAIKENYLTSRINKTKEEETPNRGIIGRNIDAAYEQNKEKITRNFLPMTMYLNEGLAVNLIKIATNAYFHLCPAVETDAREEWNGGSRTRTVWENGLKLLYTINEDVAKDWEKDSARYYGGVIPKTM